MFVFDTDTLSNLLRRSRSPSLQTRMRLVPRDQQFTTAISVGELVYGALRNPRRLGLIGDYEALLWPNFEVLPFDRPSAEAYGRIRVELERAGTPLAEPDMRIAAIALSHGFTVVTGSLRHFDRVPGLKVENWL